MQTTEQPIAPTTLMQSTVPSLKDAIGSALRPEVELDNQLQAQLVNALRVWNVTHYLKDRSPLEQSEALSRVLSTIEKLANENDAISTKRLADSVCESATKGLR